MVYAQYIDRNILYWFQKIKTLLDLLTFFWIIPSLAVTLVVPVVSSHIKCKRLFCDYNCCVETRHLGINIFLKKLKNIGGCNNNTKKNKYKISLYVNAVLSFISFNLKGTKIFLLKNSWKRL